VWKCRLTTPALVALCSLVLLEPAVAQEKPVTPETIEGIESLSTEQVKKAAAAGVLIIDARPKGAYEKERIPGSVNVVYDDQSAKSPDYDAAKDSFDISKLPEDKSREMIFTCGGPTCWRSYKASIAAKKMGYKNVKFYRGGVPEWKEKGLPVE